MKRKRKHKREAPPPTGMKKPEPPYTERSLRSGILRQAGSYGLEREHIQTDLGPPPKPDVRGALLWIALFVLFLIAVTILELALR